MRIFFLCFAIACSSNTPPTTSTTSSPSQTTPPPTTTTTPPTTTAPGIGEKCGDGDRCADGLECITYYGIAGARGPQFKTCEIRCKDDSACPKDRHCRTVADGPGQVCR